jgi:hypothetical protein
VDWAANEPRPVTVTGPGTLDVTIWRQKSSVTVHLVNLTNPMMMKGPVREFIPTPPQNVSIRLPGGLKARKVHLLVSGQTPRVQEANGAISLTIPSILERRRTMVPEIIQRAVDAYRSTVQELCGRAVRRYRFPSRLSVVVRDDVLCVL